MKKSNLHTPVLLDEVISSLRLLIKITLLMLPLEMEVTVQQY